MLYESLNIIRLLLSRSTSYTVYNDSILFEFVFWIAAVLLALLLVRLWPKRFAAVEQCFVRFASHKRRAIVAIFFLALAARLALLPWLHIPVPLVHDEYSYILGAETLASGSLTNPAHPLWVHFESFHINVVPTYQSMYPPGQAALLALGILIFGHPWWGVWLSVALMCAAVTWMLQAWMPPHWALLGGLFCILRFATFSYWVNSYYAGALGAIGGALLLGALPRLLHKRTAALALVGSLGLVVLAETRPYEGLLFSIPAVICLLVWFFRKRLWGVDTLQRVLAPAVAVLVCSAAFQLYYNWRGTGNPLLMPYVVNLRTYHITKPFLWQARGSIPEYHHRVMRNFYIRYELRDYLISQHLWGIEKMEREKIAVYYSFFVWPFLVPGIFAMWAMIKSRRLRVLPVTLLLVVAGLLLEVFPPQPQYAGPLVCVVVAIMLYGLRLLRTWRPRQLPLGIMICRASVILILAWSVVPLAQRMMDPWMLYQGRDLPPELDRARLQAQLERIPGKHLVVVHNHLTAFGAYDWIYNKPDIDGAKVVWARDMGPEHNQDLLRHFTARQIWLVDQDDGIMRLNPYVELTSEQILSAALPAAHPGKSTQQ